MSWLLSTCSCIKKKIKLFKLAHKYLLDWIHTQFKNVSNLGHSIVKEADLCGFLFSHKHIDSLLDGDVTLHDIQFVPKFPFYFWPLVVLVFVSLFGFFYNYLAGLYTSSCFSCMHIGVFIVMCCFFVIFGVFNLNF